MIEKKVLDGVGMSAALRDADVSGYLNPQEQAALFQAKMDYRSYSRGLAAEFLGVHPNALAAKQGLRDTLKHLERAAAGFDENERDLFDHFASQIDEAIDTVAGRSRFLQTISRIWFRTPSFVKPFVIMLILGAALVGVVEVFASVSGR